MKEFIKSKYFEKIVESIDNIKEWIRKFNSRIYKKF